MALRDVFQGVIEGWSKVWSAPLRAWSKMVIGEGIETFMDILAKSASKKLTPILDKIEANSQIPPELKPLFDEIRNPSGEFAASLVNSAGGAITSSALNHILDYLLRPIDYGFSFVPGYYLHSGGTLGDLLKRGIIDEQTYYSQMHMHGFSDEAIQHTLKLMQIRFPSEVVSQAWLRDPPKYGPLWTQVRSMGFDDEQIELLKELAYRIPGVQDVIRYAVREVYNPEVAERFGQFEDFPTAALEDARKAGVREDYLKKEWAAHWDLPGIGDSFKMLHRKIINSEDLQALLKAKDVMPFWRDKLTQLSWDIPNRVELRMMARYGLVDRDFLVEALGKAGLAEEYRGTVADMMIAQGALTDISKRYVNGYLNQDGVRSAIASTGVAGEMAERMYQWIVKNNQPDRVAAEREVTKAEIVRGVKTGVIEYNEGLAMLQGMNYDATEAAFILAVNTEIAGTAVNDVVKTVVDTIRRLRRKFILSHEDEVTELIAVGITPELAAAYADNDDARLAKAGATPAPAPAPDRDITKAEVLKGAKAGIITYDQARAWLENIGYTTAEAQYLLEINGIEP